MTSNLCPSCLTELPDNYPYDHVAIDRALTGSARLYGAERYEAAREGFRRGMSTTTIAWTLRLSGDTIAGIVAGVIGDERAGSNAREHVALDAEVRRRYAAGQADHHIAAALNVSRSTVQASRARMRLPALYGPGGRRRKQVAA